MSANAGEAGADNDRHDTNTNDGKSSEWTRIVRKDRRNNRGRRPHKQQQQQQQHPLPPTAGPADNFRPNAAPRLSADDIAAEHDKVAAQWRQTDACARLLAQLRDNAPACVRVARAVCLGLGAFEPEDGSFAARRRSHVQLAAFLTMIEALEKLEEGKAGHIECFYQEPRFAQPDKDFLEARGGTVVESPASYDLVDASTLVFGVHLYRDIWAAALDKSLPAMFVGTGWDVWDESPDAEKNTDFGRIRQMDAGAFKKLAFPQDDHSSFSSTCIYWKKRREAGTDGSP